MARVTARARTREDRAGDPLDGLVNLFDLGIVLSVAFLLAALSSLDLTSALFSERSNAAPPDSVVVEPGEESRPIELQPGERVVGQGEPVGTVYRLEDGRTIIVQPEGSGAVPGAGEPDQAPGGSSGDGGSSAEPGAGLDGGAGTAAPDTSLDDDIATDDTATDSGGATADEPTLGEP